MPIIILDNVQLRQEKTTTKLFFNVLTHFNHICLTLEGIFISNKNKYQIIVYTQNYDDDDGMGWDDQGEGRTPLNSMTSYQKSPLHVYL